ncbi:winged helix-turn-helix transcriptional regulator [Flexibacterium corallicola]|uniref:winged helix-turn-helix transcriptional regulator n=1 Tax=Flexibacterium corallicola TaxID=3037259 RepID=UPI00286F85E8|nr:helix-turn-helix domain-containing protein [Pseudovibrio sp. M1P-2-3]
MATAVDTLGDRWVLLILREAFYGVQRFDDILQDLNIPKSVLTDRLKRMIESGLMERFEYQEPGTRKRAAYGLTQKGRELAPVMIALKEWGEKHALHAPSPVDIQSTGSGDWLRLHPVDSQGHLIAWEDVRLVKRTA